MKTRNETTIGERAPKSRKRYVRSLEYELIAGLALQQYVSEDRPAYDRLLSIPLGERIPALWDEYGLKRMHRLVRLILQEFCLSLALPKSKKLTETKLSVCACDLILAAQEDQLSLEDLIIFFELSKNGQWGRFKGMITHAGIMQHLEEYRQERFEAYVDLKRQAARPVQPAADAERISPEPTVLKTLFEEAGSRIIPMKKIS